MDGKKLSDDELLAMIAKFEALSESDKAANLLGTGMEKHAYQIPDSDYVIKKPKYGEDDIIRDYVTHKQLGKKGIPVEQPILVKQPNQKSVLIQKKLASVSPEEAEKLKDRAEGLLKGLSHTDLIQKNVGKDADGVVKALDAGPFEVQSKYINRTHVGNLTGTDTLNRTRKAAIDKISNLNLPSAKIYRSIPIIGPAIGAGLAALSGEANAASALPILGEADSLAPSPEDAIIENPQANPELRKQALQKLMGR